jgi:hypothetical protein
MVNILVLGAITIIGTIIGLAIHRVLELLGHP